MMEKKLREHEVLKHMMEAQLRDGFHQWHIEKEVARNVAALLQDVESAIDEQDPAMAEKRVQAQAQHEMVKLRASVEGDLVAWKDTFLSRYLAPVQKAIKEESATKRPKLGGASTSKEEDLAILEKLAPDTESENEEEPTAAI